MKKELQTTNFYLRCEPPLLTDRRDALKDDTTELTISNRKRVK